MILSGEKKAFLLLYLFRALTENASLSVGLVFFFSNGIVQTILEVNEKKKTYKVILLAGNRLNSIEKIMSEVLTNVEASHEEFMLVFNE